MAEKYKDMIREHAPTQLGSEIRSISRRLQSN